MGCSCRHVDEIESLIQGCPKTKVIIDHFGFCNCQDLQSEEWRRLLALARHPQVSRGKCQGLAHSCSLAVARVQMLHQRVDGVHMHGGCTCSLGAAGCYATC